MDELREKISIIVKRAVQGANAGDRSDSYLMAYADHKTDAIMDLLKPADLVWEGVFAESPFGTYAITQYHNGEYAFSHSIFPYCDPLNQSFRAPEEAKAAAQAHYNRMWLDMMAK